VSDYSSDPRQSSAPWQNPQAQPPAVPWQGQPAPQQPPAPWQGQPAPQQPAPWQGQPGAGSPATGPATPDYARESAAQREALERRASRDLGFGTAWIVGGVLLTIITLASSSPVYVVAWGPVLYGVYLLVRGFRARSRARQ
jgi:hypothetical protein